MGDKIEEAREFLKAVGMPKEHQITGPDIRSGDRGADVVEPLGPQPSHVPAAVVDDP